MGTLCYSTAGWIYKGYNIINCGDKYIHLYYWHMVKYTSLLKWQIYILTPPIILPHSYTPPSSFI